MRRREVDDLAETRRQEMGRKNLHEYEKPSLWAWFVGILKRMFGVK